MRLSRGWVIPAQGGHHPRPGVEGGDADGLVAVVQQRVAQWLEEQLVPARDNGRAASREVCEHRQLGAEIIIKGDMVCNMTGQALNEGRLR